MPSDRTIPESQTPEYGAFAAGVRAVLPALLGVLPFGLITGVAMVASGIAPAVAILMSLVVYAGASMLAATQLLAADAPVVVIVLTALVINLRFVMYSASMRPHLGALPLRWRMLAGGLLADNAYAVCIAKFSERPTMKGKLAFFLGASLPIWLVWQLAVAAGALLGAGIPAAWKLDFAAPLVFIAVSVPLLRDRATLVAAAIAAAIAVVAHALPFRLALVLATVAGIAAGLVVERKPA